jgi:hypothetical protein
MFSPQLHTELIQVRHDEIAAGAVNEQQSRELDDASKRPRRRPGSRGRRLAIAAAVAVGLASGSAAIVTDAGHTPQAAAHGLSAGRAARELRVGETSNSFVRRIRALESRGYVEVACKVDGDLMFNPRTHRYVTVRA